MNRHQQRAVLLIGVLMISAVMLGCASNEPRDARDGASALFEQDFSRARDSIAQAERAGAAEYGNAQLALAREKLRAAETAAEDGAVERAQRLAVEADLDADLAAAITRNQQTQELAGEVRSGLRALEGELGRTESGGLERR